MANPTATLNTNKGLIEMELFVDEAPITAGNFVDLIGKGFYNGLTFHRYEPGFVIQGGCPHGTGTGGYVDPAKGTERRISLEVSNSLKHDSAGVVAMARAQHPDSASSQFYITLAAASFLDNNYAVFGKVTKGLDVVLSLRKGDKIESATLSS
ncbi:MAG: peptidylprolyl isomerase [Capsulimonadaceae bacterium]|nr:peptidylprolyl isomerase [Capsulimonadaceae bacterium]